MGLTGGFRSLARNSSSVIRRTRTLTKDAWEDKPVGTVSLAMTG
jgi:hypothetical protein